jgi:hypothetical protein
MYTITNLGQLGVAINNKGQILALGVGPGVYINDEDVVLLTPVSEPTPVPEPSSLAFFGLAEALSGGISRITRIGGGGAARLNESLQ